MALVSTAPVNSDSGMSSEVHVPLVATVFVIVFSAPQINVTGKVAAFATGIIKSMATIYGMSDIAGLMVLEKRSNQFLGGQTQKDFSDAMAKDLDDHTKNLLNERYQVVLQLLKDNSVSIEEMTAELLDIEVISGERVREIITKNGGKVFIDEDLHSDAIAETKEKTIIDELPNSSEETSENK